MEKHAVLLVCTLWHRKLRMYTCIHIHTLSLYFFMIYIYSLAEKERQEQKVNGLRKALERVEEKNKAVCQESDRVKAERETECICVA